MLSAEKNLDARAFKNWKITKGDLIEFTSDGFDIVYCIGVIHHLKDPEKGFDSVIGIRDPAAASTAGFMRARGMQRLSALSIH